MKFVKILAVILIICLICSGCLFACSIGRFARNTVWNVFHHIDDALSYHPYYSYNYGYDGYYDYDDYYYDYDYDYDYDDYYDAYNEPDYDEPFDEPDFDTDFGSGTVLQGLGVTMGENHTVVSMDVEADTAVELAVSMKVSSGTYRLVFIAPDGAVTVLSEASSIQAIHNLTFTKGLNQVVIETTGVTFSQIKVDCKAA